MNLLMLGESSFSLGGLLAPNNAPFWSLDYEGPYYWIYGAWFFLRGRWRWPLVLGLLVAAGQPVLALLPCWLAGVVLYHVQPRIALPPVAAALIMASTVVVFTIFAATDFGSYMHTVLRPVAPVYRLRFSSLAGGDYMLTVLVAVNFLAAAKLAHLGAWLLRMKAAIRAAAACTLTVYLVHMPLTVLAVAGLGLDGWPLIAAVVVPLVPLAAMTEMRRPALRRLLERIVPGGSAPPALNPLGAPAESRR